MAKGSKRDNRRNGVSPRRLNTRDVRKRFLIVCEGKRTEPNYFEGFRVPGKIEGGSERDPLRLVEIAIDWRTRKKDMYDQIWCVFDRDSVPAERFNRALELAAKEGIEVAYSTPAIEFWFLLHYGFTDGTQDVSGCTTRLERHLGRPYDRRDPTLYQVLRPRCEDAIRHAELLMDRYKPHRPADDNPSTKVHLLVRELLRSAQK